jgi:hypothetical protein
MNYRPVFAVVVTALVVLAGCSGLAPGGSGGNGTTAGSAATTVQPTATDIPADTGDRTRTPTAATAGPTTAQTATGTRAGTTTGNGTAANGSFPPGYAASGITNPERAVAQSSAALHTHDSFTLAASIPTTRPSATISIETQVNRTGKREYQTVNATLSGRQVLAQESYQNGTTRYTVSFPVMFNNSTRQYNVTTQPFASNATNTTDGLLSGWLSNATFGRAERVTRNGTTLLRYEATGVRNAGPFLSTYASAYNASVSEFDATLLVDREGIIRSFNYSVTYTTSRGQQYTTTGMVRISDIGTTTVEEPAWLDEAKAQTSLSGAAGAGNTTATSGQA